jgi:dTDP-4-amino-4,6-dideoxygalactose transaminase
MIRFSSPAPVGREREYVMQAVESRGLAGVGAFAQRCEKFLEQSLPAPRVLLTGSCTSSLELCAMLLDVAPGDEVVMPSFTFCTTASAFALRGARIVFADIDPATLCMTAREAAPLVGARTKAVVGVHYAGYGGAAPGLASLCAERGVAFVEDDAQGIGAAWQGRSLGTFGRLASISFHDTKNVTGGEGGALVVNDARLVERAEILRDKGTNRAQFFRGFVDKYTWQDLGSSYVPSELCAAYLFAQLEESQRINARRRAIALAYHDALAPLAPRGVTLPERAYLENANGHLFWLLARDPAHQQGLIEHLRGRGIAAVFHYVPLHSAPAGLKHGEVRGPMTVTDSIWNRLVRLPLHMDLSDADVESVIAACREYLAR